MAGVFLGNDGGCEPHRQAFERDAQVEYFLERISIDGSDEDPAPRRNLDETLCSQLLYRIPQRRRTDVPGFGVGTEIDP